MCLRDRRRWGLGGMIEWGSAARGEDLEECAGIDDAGGSMALGEVAEVAGDQEVGGSGLGAFEEAIVGFVRGDREAERRLNQDRSSRDGFECGVDCARGQS